MEVIAMTNVPGGWVETRFVSACHPDNCGNRYGHFEVSFKPSKCCDIDTRLFHVRHRAAREWYPAREDAENAAATFHAQEVKRRETTRHLWIGDTRHVGVDFAEDC